MPYLVVKWRGDEVHREELTGPVTIGREIGVTVWINDPALSRKHCRIEQMPDGVWRVLDLDSRNGVHVNDEQVETRTLTDGDQFRVGDARVTFHEKVYQSRRASTPEEALFASHMQPTEKLIGRPVHARAATNTRVAEKPFMPSRVNLGPTPGKPLVQPFSTAFQRAPATPKFKARRKPSRDSGGPSGSRGWLSSWFNSLRSLVGKSDAV